MPGEGSPHDSESASSTTHEEAGSANPGLRCSAAPRDPSKPDGPWTSAVAGWSCDSGADAGGEGVWLTSDPMERTATTHSATDASTSNTASAPSSTTPVRRGVVDDDPACTSVDGTGAASRRGSRSGSGSGSGSPSASSSASSSAW